MGVTGLWSVIEPSGKRVRIQTLQGKVLAVDVSIWLHQSVKGFRDKDGNPLRNAHLLGVFFRVCKLLVYGIRPVFVFDGGVPVLKKQTMATRRQRKIEAQDKSQIARNKLLRNLVKQQLQRQLLTDIPDTTVINAEVERVLKASQQSIDAAVKHTTDKYQKRGGKVRGRNISIRNISPRKVKLKPHDEDDEETLGDDFNTFKEKLTQNCNNFSVFLGYGEDEAAASESSSDSEFETVTEYIKEEQPTKYDDNFDAITSSTFDELPLNVQHDMLSDMQESRKANSWGRMDQMPKESNNFSSFQLERLRKRHTLQKKIQSVQKEMGQRHIHLSNFDELDAYKYDEDEKPQSSTAQPGPSSSNTANNAVVATNKDRGLIYVSMDKPEPRNESKQTIQPPPQQDAEQPSKSSGREVGVISLDDYVTGDWSSDDELPPILPQPPKKAAIVVELDGDLEITLTEEQQLQRAIELSMEEHEKKSQREDGRFESKRTPSPKPVASFTAQDLESKVIDEEEPEVLLDAKSPMVSEPSPEVIKSEPSDESEDDFEDVDEVKEEPKMELASSAPKPLLSISINKSEILDGDDIFADIFAKPQKTEPVYPKEEKPKSLTSTESEVLQTLSPPNREVSSTLAETITLDDDSEMDDDDIDFFEPEPKQVEEIKDDSDQETRRPKATLGVSGAGAAAASKPVKMISAQYMQAQEKLNEENEILMAAKGFQERLAVSITDQMYAEAQELLSLFGVPFLICPMEAEAQCAFLDTACLTEGTLTDDSDIWLFGGQRCYKNFFSQGERPVELFQYSEIVKHLNLDRDKMVLLALLTGSDYTVGVEGVGPVKALEIISEFWSPSIDPFDTLIRFREWWEAAQKDRSLDRGNRLREHLRKLQLKPGFPSRTVWDAYYGPTIDESLERFRWGRPDLDALKKYIHEKFGWDEKKCAVNLLPLTKALETQYTESSRQITLDRFLSMESATDRLPSKKSYKSKRMKEAMKRLRRPSATEVNLSSEDEESQDEDFAKSKKGSRVTSKTKGSSTTAPPTKRSKKSTTPSTSTDTTQADPMQDYEFEEEQELDQLLREMGVKRKRVKLPHPPSEPFLDIPQPSTSRATRSSSGPSTLVLPKMKPSKDLLREIGSQQSQLPPPPKPSPSKPPVIPQRVMAEEKKKENRKKAAEILRKKDK